MDIATTPAGGSLAPYFLDPSKADKRKAEKEKAKLFAEGHGDLYEMYDEQKYNFKPVAISYPGSTVPKEIYIDVAEGLEYKPGLTHICNM